jgi:glucosyl-3-phosphoglycerate synthase
MATLSQLHIGSAPAGPRVLHHSAFPPRRIAAERTAAVSLCLPARNEVATIGTILRCLIPLLKLRAVDEIVVVDDSTDGTADIAHQLGAEVYRQSDLRPEYGPVRGKGDAMWRALSVLRGDVVCFLDADSERFGSHFACGLIGALTCEPGIQFAKGFYRRPFRLDVGVEMPEGGGRVTELMARPLLNRFYPELSGFLQPLAGEIAARRDLLRSLPFVTGYGVDIALLIDVWRRVGVSGLAQVDLEVRQNRHQALRDLVPMAEAVLAAVLHRMAREGRLSVEDPGGVLAQIAGAAERPPADAIAHAP